MHCDNSKLPLHFISIFHWIHQFSLVRWNTLTICCDPGQLGEPSLWDILFAKYSWFSGVTKREPEAEGFLFDILFCCFHKTVHKNFTLSFLFFLWPLSSCVHGRPKKKKKEIRQLPNKRKVKNLKKSPRDTTVCLVFQSKKLWGGGRRNFHGFRAWKKKRHRREKSGREKKTARREKNRRCTTHVSQRETVVYSPSPNVKMR
jgi:hypothetical protein